MPDAPRLKPQSVTEIFDSSFRLYRENFAQFLGVLAPVYIPAILLQIVVTGSMTAELFELTRVAQQAGGPPDPSVALKIVLTNLGYFMIIMLISGLALPLATGALTRVVSGRYLGEPISIGACYAFILRIFPKYLGTIMLMGLAIFVGFSLCIVPGIFFAIWFAFTSSIIVLEGLGGTSAMGRSKQLSKDNAGRIICLWFVILVTHLALVYAFQYGLGFLLGRTGLSQVQKVVVLQAVDQIVNMVMSPFFSVAWILLYYDIRIRKEGFDLEVLARNMGAPKSFFEPAPPPPAPPSAS